MARTRQMRHKVERDDVNRWLVSYADYMTLLFALFVVLYAMAIVNEKPFESVTKSIGKVFQADKEEVLNKGQGEGLLNVNTVVQNTQLYGNGVLDTPGPEVMEGDKMLSNIKDHKVGATLSTLEDGLKMALFDLIENGYAQLQIDGDWLVIELSSGLLFPSGSISITNNAKEVLKQIDSVIGNVSNFIRIRGYTDNQPINTEIFSSNWELSVYRATAIVSELEKLNLNPARMAIEGYGQHYPTADNATEEGRAKNRMVAIAISKYGVKEDGNSLPAVEPASQKDIAELAQSIEKQKNEIKIIQLENGGIRITTRDEKSKDDGTNN